MYTALWSHVIVEISPCSSAPVEVESYIEPRFLALLQAALLLILPREKQLPTSALLLLIFRAANLSVFLRESSGLFLECILFMRAQ
jgi:hypothetical protein